MQNITITINGVTKKLALIDMEKNGERSTAEYLINRQWYREVEEKDYEILEFKGRYGALWTLKEDGIYTTYPSEKGPATLKQLLHFVKGGYGTIHSVKRLSDGEVFTVGEEEKTVGIILKIEISGGTIFLYRYSHSIYLQYAEKVKQPTVLLTTEDGKEITDGEKIIYWCNKDFDTYDLRAGDLGGNLLGCKYFSTQESRDEYIQQNKPVSISYTELTKAIKFNIPQLDLLITFFKQKII